MAVRKRGKSWVTTHCHGRKKNKIISKFPTKKKAMAQHRAIQANKRGK